VKRREADLVSKGEKTKKQVIGDTIGMMTNLTGFGRAAKGTYKVYRVMRANPTIALARAVATAPIRLASWTVETKEENEEIVKFIETEMKKHWRSFIKDILFALDYGWTPFEKVWEMNPEGKWVYKKLKPLLVDKTKIILDADTGIFGGLQNASVKLLPEKCFVYSYDMEAGNYYGRSRHENIRGNVWTHWNGAIEKYGQYLTKVSGIIPMIQYPEGISTGAGGADIDNFDIATKVLQNLGSGNGITMPNTLVKWAEDAVKSGMNVSELKAWIITFLETKGNHGSQFVETFKHLESLMMRGWLVPERAATEGRFGTKAESAVQGEIGVTIADLLYEEILEAINWHIINPLLVYNFGVEYENKVYLTRAGPDPRTRELLSKIMEKILTAPANTDLAMEWLNIDSMIDSLSLPKNEEAIKPREDSEEEMREEMKKINDKIAAII
jgi:hypothetical protein